jgi:protein-export membrane protein SecD
MGILVLIALMVTVALTGVGVGNYRIAPIAEDMNLGLDIKGGVVVVYEAQTDATGTELARLMEQTKGVISRRVNALGLTEPNISIQGEKRLRIELPGVDNAGEAIEVIGQTAQLEFALVDADDMTTIDERREDFSAETVLTGQNVEDAEIAYDQDNRPGVGLTFDSEGARAFEAASRKAVESELGFGQIAILLDGVVISAPVTEVIIASGEAIISGNFTLEEAGNLAALIRGGALPVNLTEIQTSVIGPTLGLNSLKLAIDAAKIGLVLVMAYMILYYRLPGVLASLALVLYGTIVLFVMTAFEATLTLPGVAGIVLSFGMAVDANVIIFERIKEELAVGKTLRSSIKAGFQKALRTIVDANVTTVIAAIILYIFGEGPIRGFSVTLMIGIATSMLTAVFVTRTMLFDVIMIKALNKKNYFGHKEVENA